MGFLQIYFQKYLRKTKQLTTFALNQILEFRKTRTGLYGKCTLRYLGPVIWNTVPLKLKQIKPLNGFKTLIRNWKPNNCTCKLCRNYIQNLGFL